MPFPEVLSWFVEGICMQLSDSMSKNEHKPRPRCLKIAGASGVAGRYPWSKDSPSWTRRTFAKVWCHILIANRIYVVNCRYRKNPRSCWIIVVILPFRLALPWIKSGVSITGGSCAKSPIKTICSPLLQQVLERLKIVVDQFVLEWEFSLQPAR